MTDRAVSTSLSYVLGLAIATVLITGLVTAAAGEVSQNRERAITTEMQVIGQQVASDLQHADRLVAAGEGTTEVEIETKYPEAVAGSRYRIELVVTGSPSRQFVNVSTQSPDVSVSVRVSTETDIVDGRTVLGGTVVTTFEDADGDGTKELVIENE